MMNFLQVAQEQRAENTLHGEISSEAKCLYYVMFGRSASILLP